MIFSVVLKKEFERKSKNNPLNLFRQCNYCNSPQPRYKLHPYHSVAFPEYKYLAFYQCLPGCVNLHKVDEKKTYFTNNKGRIVHVNVTNDTSCLAFDPSPANNVSKPTNVKRKILNFYIK